MPLHSAGPAHQSGRLTQQALSTGLGVDCGAGPHSQTSVVRKRPCCHGTFICCAPVLLQAYWNRRADFSGLAWQVPVQMELGGKDACIVCEDADLDLAAANIVKGGFSYSGQRCTAVKLVRALRHSFTQAACMSDYPI